MDWESACELSGRVPKANGGTVTVSVPINTGSYHRISVLSPQADGSYTERAHEQLRSDVRPFTMEARPSEVVYQRTTSPAYGGRLERFGVVLPDGHVEWGADSSWPVDFGPTGETTVRRLRVPLPVTRPAGERVVTPAIGGAVQGVPSTSGGSG